MRNEFINILHVNRQTESSLSSEHFKVPIHLYSSVLKLRSDIKTDIDEQCSMCLDSKKVMILINISVFNAYL